MKIIIFGGSGFLGEYLAKVGVKRGHEIFIFDKTKTNYENTTFIEGDILEKDQVKKSIKGMDLVYNLCAISDIDDCISNPSLAVRINVVGNVNVMEGCVKHKVDRLIFASSAYAGGNHGGIYASTKKSSEMLIRDFNKFYGLNYTILRYGTLYGVGAPMTNSICRYLTNALIDKKIDYTGNGEEIREYIHIEDASHLSYDILEDKKSLNSIVSLTGDSAIKTKDLFTMIDEILNGEIKINYNKEITKGRTATHYRVSPYTYEREKVYKLSKNINRDMGDTLIEILTDIDDRFREHSE